MQLQTNLLDLRLCDNMQLMSEYPDGYFELAIVDPPYGINRDGHRGDKKHGWKKHNFGGWDNTPPPQDYFKELFRISKNQIICGANYFTKYLPSSKGWVFWDKGQKLTMSDGEFIFTSFDVAARSITINRCAIKLDGSIHPTQKPVALYKWLLENYAKQGDKILDTHLGSGSIAIACHDYGYSLTGCELDPDYFSAMRTRIENHIAQPRMFAPAATQNKETKSQTLF